MRARAPTPSRLLRSARRGTAGIATCAASLLAVVGLGQGETGCSALVGADFDRDGQAAEDEGGASLTANIGDAEVAPDDSSLGPGDDDTRDGQIGTGGFGDDDSGDATVVRVTDSGIGGDDATTDGGPPGQLDSGAPDAAPDGSLHSDGGTSVVLCGDMSGLQTGSPWPMEGACPTRANHSIAAPLTAPKIAWRFDLQPASTAEFLSAPVIAADGTIYAIAVETLGDASNQYVLLAVKNQVQSFATNIGTLAGAPAIGRDGTIYVHTRGALLSINPSSGAILHTVPLLSSSVDPPTILNDGTIALLDSTRLVLINNNAVAHTFTLPTSPAETFTGSIAVSPSGVLFAMSRRTNQVDHLLYGIDTNGQIAVGPVTTDADGDDFPQIDNAGNIFVAGDGTIDLYSSTGMRLAQSSFADTLSQPRAGYSGAKFWLAPQLKGPTSYTESSGATKTYTATAGGVLSSFAVVGDGSIVFYYRPESIGAADKIESWSSGGTLRWALDLQKTNQDIWGVAVDAAGVIYVPDGPTLFAISD